MHFAPHCNIPRNPFPNTGDLKFNAKLRGAWDVECRWEDWSVPQASSSWHEDDSALVSCENKACRIQTHKDCVFCLPANGPAGPFQRPVVHVVSACMLVYPCCACKCCKRKLRACCVHTYTCCVCMLCVYTLYTRERRTGTINPGREPDSGVSIVCAQSMPQRSLFRLDI